MKAKKTVTLRSEELGPREFTEDHAKRLLDYQLKYGHNHWKEDDGKKVKQITTASQNDAPNSGTNNEITKDTDQQG